MKLNIPSILFMGTPYFAAEALKALSGAGFNIIGVVTRPDSSKGRSSAKSPSAVKTEALNLNLPSFQPENKKELTEIVEKLKPELVIIAAYGMLVPAEVLDVPKYGTLNIHGSLLPKYRGASPITEAIINGDKETGITIMTVSIGMDEGDIIKQYELPIFSPNSHPYESEDILCQAKDNVIKYDTTETLTEKLAKLGSKAIVETIPNWISGKMKAIPQDDSKASYCRLITKEDGHIDWNKPAEEIERLIRAYQPWPTAYAFINDSRIKILSSRHCEEPCDVAISSTGVLHFESGRIYIGTDKGALEILELQPEGKKPMSAKDFINGNKGLDGTKLS